jgi:hypothetical protein
VRARHRDARRAVTGCDRARSREARLRVQVSEWAGSTGPGRQTIVAALLVFVLHDVLLWMGAEVDGRLLCEGR